MMLRRFLIRGAVPILLLVTSKIFGQFSVTGPTCVLADVPIQYNVIGPDTFALQICVQGGVISDQNILCYTSSYISYTGVIWNSDVSEKNISFHSSTQDTTIAIQITERLNSGVIDTACLFTTISIDSVPATIFCSEAKGGNCNSVYEYQWQQSSNAENWINITGNTSKDLIFLSPLTQSTYFRREVLEKKSSSIDYSDVSMVVVTF